MTNKEGLDEGDSPRETRVAALMAVHLVSQVLDEAYVIASAASASGQPWNYLEMLKSLRYGKLGEMTEENITFSVHKDELTDLKGDNLDDVGNNAVVTSTPQKEENTKYARETNFSGQGDEENVLQQNELTKCTSMFISNLFDMSEVEHVMVCDDTAGIQSDSEPNDLLTQAMAKIMESCLGTAIGFSYGSKMVNLETLPRDKTPSTDNSGYSFLADAFTKEVENVISGDVAFCFNSDVVVESKDNENTLEGDQKAEKVEERLKINDVELYENAYLTMNRDYDQNSEDDGHHSLQDPKSMTMQEVELMQVHTSDESTPRNDTKKEDGKVLNAISAVSASSRKSSLVQRCRSQSARLLACLRGWWRRKTPGKRKDTRKTSVRGLCPLSPDARRRAASLLDQRVLDSSPPDSHHVWKFNTVSEALVNSARWKNYAFEADPQECAEY